MDIIKIKSVLTEAKEPAFRLKQVRQAVFGQLIESWGDAMTLSSALRDKLAAGAPLMSLSATRQISSKRGDTIKTAFQTFDGHVIETVLLVHGDGRRTVCVSSQAGCAMACSFCATGKLGFGRNLTTEEILDQVLHYSRFLKPRNERVTNIVIMGMGEPMHNYDSVLSAIREMNAPDGLGIGARRISISTCGVVPGIERLAEEPLQLNLAISLHGPTQDVREKLMPVAKVYDIGRLMNACRVYVEKTGRKLFFEYLLIDGVNDLPEMAEDLADLMNHPLYHVNLIKYHTTGKYLASSREHRDAFMGILERRGVPVTFRQSYGEDILAACGQLAGQDDNKLK